jgi:hypothetical protein
MCRLGGLWWEKSAHHTECPPVPGTGVSLLQMPWVRGPAWILQLTQLWPNWTSTGPLEIPKDPQMRRAEPCVW